MIQKSNLKMNTELKSRPHPSHSMQKAHANNYETNPRLLPKEQHKGEKNSQKDKTSELSDMIPNWINDTGHLSL